MHDVVVREIGRIGVARGAKMKSVFIDRPTIRVEQALERTDSIRLNRRELQFFRMMTFALALFPIRECGSCRGRSLGMTTSMPKPRRNIAASSQKSSRKE